MLGLQQPARHLQPTLLFLLEQYRLVGKQHQLHNAQLAVLIMPPICLIAFMMSITLGDHSVMLWGRDRFDLLGLELGWYGVAGLSALLSGPLLYPVFNTVQQTETELS